MTGLVRFELDNRTQRFRLARGERGEIATDGGFESAVWISLFSDQRARPSDRVTDRRGWWGDAHARAANDQIGSRLWLYRRMQVTQQTARLVQVAATEALQWMRADMIAKQASVTVEVRGGVIWLRPVITRPDGSTWSQIWDIHGKKAQVQNAVF